MYRRVIAFDLDGTLAREGVIPLELERALEECRALGHALFVVTGRRFESISLGRLPEICLGIVWENGAVLVHAASGEVYLPFGQLSPILLKALGDAGIPFEHGLAIAATWKPYERQIWEVLETLGGGASVEYNKGAVMLLPSGAAKGAGLERMLALCGFSARNLAAFGDAENDVSMLQLAEVSVAVGDAVPSVLEVSPQAQLIETRVMNLLHFQTMVASKAARSTLVASGKSLIDFGLRRAHGAEAGLLAARASYLAGFTGTATVLAGPAFGIPVYGTMAHSFVQAHEEETTAFERFAVSHPWNTVLLLDIYDTEAAARKIVSKWPSWEQHGIRIQGVRLDSGDLADHARKVRGILDKGGLSDVKIVASGSLDEEGVRALVGGGAPIDTFAIGTSLTTSADAPYLDCAYKLQEYAGRPRRKRSEGKATWPGRKQVYRYYDANALIASDVLTLHDDPQPGEALIHPYVVAGKRLDPPMPLWAIREHATEQLARLPKPLKELGTSPSIPVAISRALQELAQSVDDAHDEPRVRTESK